MVAGYRARVAPFNVNYRYVEEELLYLLGDAKAKALVYAAEFAPHVQSIRGRLPDLQVLIQVADDSGNDLLPDAVDYESIVGTPAPAGGMPTPSGDDLYILYTGGTTGMPKGVLWRQHDIFMSAMGGRPFMAGGEQLNSYDDLAEQARTQAGVRSLLLIPPLMHGAAQWGVFNTISTGGWIALPDDVDRLDADAVLRLAERERVLGIPVVGDAIARPLVDEIEKGDYDLSGLMAITNGGATLSPTVRDRLLAALPNLMIMDAVGASESGAQMTTVATKGADIADRDVHRTGRHHRRLRRLQPACCNPARARAGWRAGSSCRWATSATPRRPRAPSPPSTVCAGRSPVTRRACSTTAASNCSAATR